MWYSHACAHTAREKERERETAHRPQSDNTILFALCACISIQFFFLLFGCHTNHTRTSNQLFCCGLDQYTNFIVYFAMRDFGAVTTRFSSQNNYSISRDFRHFYNERPTESEKEIYEYIEYLDSSTNIEKRTTFVEFIHWSEWNAIQTYVYVLGDGVSNASALQSHLACMHGDHSGYEIQFSYAARATQ